MVEAAVQKHPFVDLDEFERRLRGGSIAQPRSANDPLAELARLVNADQTRDPYTDEQLFAQKTESSVVQFPNAQWQQLSAQEQSAHEAPQLRGSFSTQDRNHMQEQFIRELQQLHAQPATHVNDIYEQSDPPHARTANYDEFADDELSLSVHDDLEPARASGSGRSRRPVMIMSSIFAIGLLSIGATFAYRGQMHTTSGDMPTIKAVLAPVKVAPPSNDGVIVPNQDTNILDKNAIKTENNKVNNTGVANSAEQPVDVDQVVKKPSQLAVVPSALSSGASDPGNMATFGQPRRVRTVSIHSDGTIAENTPGGNIGAATQVPVPVPTVRVARPEVASTSGSTGAASTTSAAAAATTPATKPAAPKSVVRVVSPTKLATPSAHPAAATSIAANANQDANNDQDAGGGPMQLLPSISNLKPPTGIGRTKLIPSAVSAKTIATTQSAPATVQTAAATSTSAGGLFAVQLAAPRSEAEAKQTIARLSKQYGDSLDGHRMSIVQAVSNGEPVYRVRVTSLSKDDASALCNKIQGAGGACFLAR